MRCATVDGCVEVWCDNYTSGDDPDEYFSELKAALREYREAFCEDNSAVALIDSGLVTVDGAIEALRAEMPVERGREGYYGAGAQSGQSGGSRSIFDDVDQ